MTTDQRVLPNVSLICTLFNEARGIRDFLASIFQGSTLPAELIVVDGGSTDGTAAIIEETFRQCAGRVDARLIVDPTCSGRFTPGPISRGRNVAIRNATHDIIACTDAGCRLDREWLKAITAPMRDDTSVSAVGGWYVAEPGNGTADVVAFVTLVPPGAVNPASFIPSSRSLAFRKKVWELVGGYSEEVLSGDDTEFVLAMRKLGVAIHYAPDAIVYWPMMTSIPAFARLASKYGLGDGLRLIRISAALKNLVKLLLPAGLLALGMTLSPWLLLGIPAYYAWIIFRIRKPEPRYLLRFPLLMLVKAIGDGGYLWGFCKGAITKKQPGTVPVRHRKRITAEEERRA